MILEFFPPVFYRETQGGTIELGGVTFNIPITIGLTIATKKGKGNSDEASELILCFMVHSADSLYASHIGTNEPHRGGSRATDERSDGYFFVACIGHANKNSPINRRNKTNGGANRDTGGDSDTNGDR